MKELQKVFEFKGCEVRTIIRDGEPWFVAKDVCEVLGISKYRDVVGNMDEDERESMIVDTPGGKQNMLVVNEPGLYRLIFSSTKEEAKIFKRWVFHEVLPSIRRTGTYSLPKGMSIPELLREMYGEKEAQKLIEANIQSHQVTIGFPFHDDNYLTVKEAAQEFGLDERTIWAELRAQGYIEPVFCEKGQYG